MPEDADAEKGFISTSSPIGAPAPQQGRRRFRHGVDAERHPQVRNSEARHHPRRSIISGVTEPRDSYSPERRTALLFTGTGADGAYHAGAMRALQEAGVKIDIVGGRGIGAVSAVLAAVDGSAQLWEDGGFWRSDAVPELYRWRWPFRALRLLGISLIAVLAVPALVIAAALFVYPAAMVLGMAGLESGSRLVEGFVALLSAAFSPSALPSWLPRAGAVAVHRGVDGARRGRVGRPLAVAALSALDRQLAVDAAGLAARCRAWRSSRPPKRSGASSRAARRSRHRNPKT